MFDIIIVNYNRLPYLQKCVWSIIASGKHNIYVADDGSIDGSKEWIEDMVKRKKLKGCFLNDKIGTAANFDKAIRLLGEKWIVIANEDMWFHRGWDAECEKITEKYIDCGIVSFYDYTRVDRNLDPGIQDMGDCKRVIRTGLGASMINKALYEAAGGFRLPKGKTMGFFASKFCQSALKTNLMRKKVYSTVPNYATNMDIEGCELEEFAYIDNNGYRELREKQKNFKSQRKWY